MKRRLIWLLLFSLAVVALLMLRPRPDAVPPGHTELFINIGGLQRRTLLHLPKNAAPPIPLVLMLHGMGGNGKATMLETGWSEKADAHGFMVAYPEATRPHPSERASLRSNPPAWNDGSGRFHAAEQQIDDVAFIRRLIDELSLQYKIDPNRVYAAGFSNGASMTFRIGAELSDRLAAIAPGAGACWSSDIRPARGLSLCYITGTADTLNPIDGGIPQLASGKEESEGKAKPPIMDHIQKWTKALGCPLEPTADTTSNGVRTRSYGPGREGAEVRFITIEGLGHMWPGGSNRVPEFLVGKPSDKLKATDVIWQFFSEHPMR
jgi:polyhydroxybutyrate depolymerase